MILKTENKNYYLLSQSIPQILYLHPILAYLIEQYRKGINLKKWINSTNQKTIFHNGEKLKVNKEEIFYYYKYFQLLKKAHYFDEPKKIKLEEAKKYNSEDIKFSLANTAQLSFEVTDRCNLKCYYCGYGKFYEGYDKRRGKNLSFNTAKVVIDYLISLQLKYQEKIKTYKKIAFSFYGGEPLINFPLIKKIVNYSKGINIPNIEFIFSITTNGTLLHKYIEYFVREKFFILISLDGDKRNNEYRVFPNGGSSHEIIYKNAMTIMKNYPQYFSENVRFISVLHDKNSAYEVLKYFNDNFGKNPIILGLSRVGLRQKHIKEFEKMLDRKYSYSEIKKINKYFRGQKNLDSSQLGNLNNFIKVYSGFTFNKINNFLYRKDRVNYITTGTCHPFEKKVFITLNGKILPCERVLQEYYLGKILKTKIKLDFYEIAKKYNEYYKRMGNLCNNCFNSEICSSCIFQLNLKDSRIHCPNYRNKNEFISDSSKLISSLEKSPSFYPLVIKNLEREIKL